MESSMIEIKVTSNEKELKKKMNVFQRKHLPKATAEALNAIALKVANAERAQLQKKLDRPTPFTIKSINYSKANARHLDATIFIKDIAAKYLHYPLSGEAENASKGMLVPVTGGEEVLTRFGNVQGAKQGTTANKRGRFFKGKYLFKNVSGGVKLLAVWKDQIQHRKFMDFFKIAFGLIKKNYDRELDRQIKKAIKK